MLFAMFVFFGITIALNWDWIQSKRASVRFSKERLRLQNARSELLRAQKRARKFSIGARLTIEFRNMLDELREALMPLKLHLPAIMPYEDVEEADIHVDEWVRYLNKMIVYAEQKDMRRARLLKFE